MSKQITLYLLIFANIIDVIITLIVPDKTGQNNLNASHIASGRLAINKPYAYILFMFHVVPMFLLAGFVGYNFVSNLQSPSLFLYIMISVIMATCIRWYRQYIYGFVDNEKRNVLTYENGLTTTHFVSTFFIPTAFQYVMKTSIPTKYLISLDVVFLVMVYCKYLIHNGNILLFIQHPLYLGMMIIKLLHYMLKKDGKMICYTIMYVFLNSLTIGVPNLNYISYMVGLLLYLKS